MTTSFYFVSSRAFRRCFIVCTQIYSLKQLCRCFFSIYVTTFYPLFFPSFYCAYQNRFLVNLLIFKLLFVFKIFLSSSSFRIDLTRNLVLTLPSFRIYITLTCVKSGEPVSPHSSSSHTPAPKSNTPQATHAHPALDDAAAGMKEAVQELQVTLEEAASESGIVTGLVDSIHKALSDAGDVSVTSFM